MTGWILLLCVLGICGGLVVMYFAGYAAGWAAREQAFDTAVEAWDRANESESVQALRAQVRDMLEDA